jgi:hypothetical protein
MLQLDSGFAQFQQNCTEAALTLESTKQRGE